MNKQQDIPVQSDRSLEDILARGASSGRFGALRAGIVAAAVLVGAAAGYYFLAGQGEGRQIRYLTEPAAMGRLVVRVSATGNLQPTNQVDVGSELSGIVEEVYVDDNDSVARGQVLARLDLSKLEDAVARSTANLDVANAQVLQAQATAVEARANFDRLREVSRLSAGKVPSRSELDTAQANVKRAEANEAAARAGVAQAEAALQSDKTNLDKAYIRSPIDGVVLVRQVEPGQTVAASFQAPVLFTLAEDLTNMELKVDVDEAEVGKVGVGQEATFTVDAWPGRRFDAEITKVGYGSEVKEGVVSYPATLHVDNDDLSLRPGMTATADITTLSRDNVLLVSNAALRFTPSTQPAARESSGGLLRALIPRRPRQARRQLPSNSAEGARRVWVLRDGAPMPVEVQTGPSDGRVTEITGGDIQAGTELITEVVTGSR